MLSRKQVKKALGEQMFTTTQACEFLDVTQQNLHLACNTGRLEPLHKTGRETLYWRKDIVEYKESYSRKK